MAKKVSAMDSPLLIAVGRPAKAVKNAARDKAAPVSPANYEPPNHAELLKQRAQSAHRDTVEKWVRGEASTRKVAQSKSRMKKVLRGCV